MNQGGQHRVIIANPAVPNITGGSPNAMWTLTVLADHDGDLVPDVWEAAHGFNTNDVTDAAQDADGDYLSNREEWIAGTNPTNALDYLKVDRLTASGSATIDFWAVSNRTYTVQYADDLGTGTWGKSGRCGGPGDQPGGADCGSGLDGAALLPAGHPTAGLNAPGVRHGHVWE